MTYEEIQELEHDLEYQRNTLALAWDRKWCGAGHIKSELHILTDATLELFEAYGEFEQEWQAYLFKKLT